MLGQWQTNKIIEINFGADWLTPEMQKEVSFYFQKKFNANNFQQMIRAYLAMRENFNLN